MLTYEVGISNGSATEAVRRRAPGVSTLPLRHGHVAAPLELRLPRGGRSRTCGGRVARVARPSGAGRAGRAQRRVASPLRCRRPIPSCRPRSQLSGVFVPQAAAGGIEFAAGNPPLMPIEGGTARCLLAGEDAIGMQDQGAVAARRHPARRVDRVASSPGPHGAQYEEGVRQEPPSGRWEP